MMFASRTVGFTCSCRNHDPSERRTGPAPARRGAGPVVPVSHAVPTTCPYCGVGCGVLAGRRDDAVTVRGDPNHPANEGRLCSKGTALADTLDLDERLLAPQIHGRRASWDEALDTAAHGFSRIIREHGPEAVAFYVSGQLLTEDYYVANKLMKGFIGSANIDTNSRLCMSSAVVGHQRAFGEDVVPGCYEDLEQADLVVLVGSNTAWCHPVVYRRIEAARQARGMTLVVIDPRRTATAAEADLHLPIAPGSDVALFNGLLAYLSREGVRDDAFVADHTTGLDKALGAAIAGGGELSALAVECGLPEADLARFFHAFAGTEQTVTLFSQGVNQSSAGADKVNAIINCHLYTGRIGKPGAGPFSITGQPNAMGGREAGGMASTLAAHRGFEAADSVAGFWQAPAIARAPGLKAVDMFQAIGDGRIKAVWIMATNPLVSLPDADEARKALARCDLVVASDYMAATDTVEMAHVRLPAASWGEKDGTVTNSERRISRQRAFLQPPGEARPDWWIICEVARRMGFGKAFDYAGPHAIFAEHAALSAHNNDGRYVFDIGGLADVSRSEYDAMTPRQWPVAATTLPNEGAFTIPQAQPPDTGRLFRAGRFPTDDGCARFVAVTPRTPVNAPDADYPLILNTGRVRDHWHSMTRTGKSARLSGHIVEPRVSVHPDDARTAGTGDGRIAELASRWGRMRARVAEDEGQQRGSVFVPIHWSAQYAGNGRVGALVNPVTDPDSGQPESKHTPVRMAAFEAAWHGFMLSRTPLSSHAEPGLDYWVRIKGAAFWRYELAGVQAPADWAPWARRQLRAVGGAIDWLEYRDPQHGSYRAAALGGGRLESCLFVASEPPALPERAWLAQLFERDALDSAERTGLLAGAPADPNANAGEVVCSCFGVGRNTLAAAIRDQGLDSPAAVGEALKAGTNCGSCVPDLKAMIEEIRS